MNVRFSPSAQADIQSIHDHIAADNPVAAARVVATIEQSIDRLERFPFSGRTGAVDRTRELVIPHLPYIVVYTVSVETVDIIAVFHAAQNNPRGFG